MGKKTTGNALLFRDLLNAEGIRSKALTVCSGAWGGKPVPGLYMLYKRRSVKSEGLKT